MFLATDQLQFLRRCTDRISPESERTLSRRTFSTTSQPSTASITPAIRDIIFVEFSRPLIAANALLIGLDNSGIEISLLFRPNQVSSHWIADFFSLQSGSLEIHRRDCDYVGVYTRFARALTLHVGKNSITSSVRQHTHTHARTHAHTRPNATLARYHIFVFFLYLLIFPYIKYFITFLC